MISNPHEENGVRLRALQVEREALMEQLRKRRGPDKALAEAIIKLDVEIKRLVTLISDR